MRRKLRDFKKSSVIDIYRRFLLSAFLGLLVSCESPTKPRPDSSPAVSGTKYLASQPGFVPPSLPPIPPAPAPAPTPESSDAYPPDAPSIVARSAIIVDNATGKILYRKNVDTRRPVASTQKLLTALVVTESGSLNRMITVDASDAGVEPYKIGLKPGESYTRHALLEALLVRSGNDVAHCLARTLAGSEAAFADYMNQKAYRLGMLNSRFVNASGLPAEGQYSTARDLSILAMAALRNPVIAPITRMRGINFRFSDGRVKSFKSTNELLEKSPYCHGMKTGYTRASGRCLVSCGTNGGRTIIVVVLHSSWENVWTDSKKLLHWGLGVP